jgi:hypothetical protein
MAELSQCQNLSIPKEAAIMPGRILYEKKKQYFEYRKTMTQDKASEMVGRSWRTGARWEKEASDRYDEVYPWDGLAIKWEIRRQIEEGNYKLLAAVARDFERRLLARYAVPSCMLDEYGEAPGAAWEIVERRKHQPDYKGYDETRTKKFFEATC